jgi:hypothetical protein
MYRCSAIGLYGNVAAKRAADKNRTECGEKNGEESEAHEGCVDAGNAGRIAEALKGQDTRREDFEADEAHGWCAAPAGISAWYRPRASTLSPVEAIGSLEGAMHGSEVCLPRHPCGIEGVAGRLGAPSHSMSLDQRRRPETFFTAMAMAFFCPTRTTSRLPRVTPV